MCMLCQGADPGSGDILFNVIVVEERPDETRCSAFHFTHGPISELPTNRTLACDENPGGGSDPSDPSGVAERSSYLAVILVAAAAGFVASLL